MYVINFRIAVPNPLTLGVLHYHQAAFSKKKHGRGQKILVWTADRSGQVEATVHSMSSTRRGADDFRWKLVGEAA